MTPFIYQTDNLRIVDVLPMQVKGKVCMCLAFEPVNENLGDFMHLALVFAPEIEQNLPGDLWKVVSEINWQNAVPLRIHSECLLGDVMGSQDCDCNAQLNAAMTRIATHDGIIIYLRQEGRGIGLRNKFKCLSIQKGYTSGQYHGEYYSADEANLHYGFEKDHRVYSLAAELLKSLGISHVNLSTGNPEKVHCLIDHGLTVQKSHFEHRLDEKNYSQKALNELKEKLERGYAYDYLNHNGLG